MEPTKSFSERHGYTLPEAEISIRHEAPDWLRSLIVRIAYDAGLQPSDLRSIVCDLLLEAPDSSNWSEFPNVDNEVQGLISKVEWFQVYELIELLADTLQLRRVPIPATNLKPLDHFTTKLNAAFRRKGVGWQLLEGHLQIRGPESFEVAVRQSNELLEATGRQVASHEMHQALADLSRRPNPDITGAIQHAIAALECVARDVTGDQNATLGDLIKHNPGLLPTPLDKGVEKIWGYASDQARHVREGRALDIREAELVVGLAGSLAMYLVKKFMPQPCS